MSGDGTANKGANASAPALEPNNQKSSTVSDPSQPRETSPLRAARSSSSIPQISRSRKSSQEFSPTRNNAPLSTIPSAAAVQRALSVQRPVLQPGGVDGTVDSVKTDKPRPIATNPTPSWPTSPRLKSPPPATTRQALPKRSEGEIVPSNTSMKRHNTGAGLENSSNNGTSESTMEQSTTPHSTSRPPGRGVSAPSSVLETVAEGSVPSTPSVAPMSKSVSDLGPEISSLSATDASSDSTILKNGDQSDAKASAVKEVDSKPRAPSSTRAASSLAKRSLTNLTSSRPKPPDPPRTMTIETEPVVSNSQILGPDRNLTGRDGGGSVRTRPSSETIRPKKEKKKSARKAPVLPSGTVTSKADIFEARVASAVDEADTSDSDETFVYESNPPDARNIRHHSRTPSATSLASTDHQGRNRHGLRSGSHAVGAKKSMKFTNSGYNNGLDEGDEGRSSVRNASSHRHHHIGRHGKSAHSSILDSNSPFNQASKGNSPRTSTGNLARLSRPNSPRMPNGRAVSSPKKGDAFDIYDNPADDERTPLMPGGSVRVNRNRHSRRMHGSGLRNSDYYEDVERGVCSRLGGCLLLGVVVLIVCAGMIIFVIGLSQPLVDVKVRHLQNILASEQELMLDLHVDAVNTNIFAISVSDLDVNIFAESSYVGSSKDYQGQQQMRWVTRSADEDVDFPWPFPQDGVDDGTDPVDEEPGAQKMLLGTILEFDSPLMFDASPLRRRRSSSVGEIRLARPGNKTEIGGSARWERVIQHDFNLIVRGVIKYQLPLSSRTRSVKIASKATVRPDDDDDGTNTTTLQRL
jgi:hypothetical protein